jgi:hypothetical protein
VDGGQNLKKNIIEGIQTFTTEISFPPAAGSILTSDNQNLIIFGM